MKTTTLAAAGFAACALALDPQLATARQATWVTVRSTVYTPIGGFTARPTPPPRAPRHGLVARERDEDEDEEDEDEDDEDEDEDHSRAHGSFTRVTSSPRPTSTQGGSTHSGSSSTSTSGSTSTSASANTCGWEKGGGGFYACNNAGDSCSYSNGGASCCRGSGHCKDLPRTCVDYSGVQSKKCDSDSDGKTVCCRASSAPHCYTWIMSATATTGNQQGAYTILGCSDKAGTATLVPTDPATSSSSKSSGGSNTNTGAIAGGVVGGVAGLGLLGALLWYIMKQKRTGRRENEEALRKQAEADAEHQAFAGAAASGALTEKKRDIAALASDERRGAAFAAYAHGHSPSQESRSVGSPDGNLTYSTSMASQAHSGWVSNPSPVPPMAGVVEAPDSRVEDTGAPVEVPGTTVTRETIQNRAELG